MVIDDAHMPALTYTVIAALAGCTSYLFFENRAMYRRLNARLSRAEQAQALLANCPLITCPFSPQPETTEPN